MTQVYLLVEDVREARRQYGGYCVRGMGAWFERYGMNLREFLKNGYPVERIEATNDEFGLKAAAIARKRARG